MARSALGGFVLGTVLAVGSVVTYSVVQNLTTPRPEAGAVDLPAGSGFDGAREDRAAELPGSDPVQAPPGSDRADAPKVEDDSGIASAETTPAAQPQTGADVAALGSPDAGAETSAPMASASDSTEPPRSATPALPGLSADAPVQAIPERPINPEVSDSPALAAQPAAPDAAPVAAPVGNEVAAVDGRTAPPASPTVAATEAQPDRPDPLPTATASASPPQEQSTPQPDSTPTAPAAADAAPQPAEAASRPEIAPDREPAIIVALPKETAPERPKLPKVGETVAATPRIGKPAVRLTDRDEGTAAVAADPSQEPAPQPDPTSAAPDPQLPPLQAFAASFDNPENKPLMAIVLIDRGSSALDLEALASFPYPLSFAVDVTSPEALARMQRYRAAGFEVLALSDMPAGATAGDTETLLRAGLRELPEVVAVMEGDKTGLQGDKAVSDQVSAVLSETGHGVVFFSKGLNTAQKLASKAGVAALSVFRDFDGKGQNATVMRRFLDQAAFKARQQEAGVVMVGRLQPETISALLLWGLQDRASWVALAPISALLQASRGP